MTSYGGLGARQNYKDGRTWKTDGVISVDGVLYVVVARQVDGFGGYPLGYQSSTDASIIKSTDHGRTWSNSFGTTDDPNGAAPPPNPSGSGAEAMFPGSSFGTPVFINYGKDDDPASTADGGDQYVYAISNDGWAYDGNYEILGRVLRSKIGDLSAADWQFYSGPAGGDGSNPANWSSDVGNATHILSAAHQLDQGGVQYLPGLHSYILTTGYYPFNSQWPQGPAGAFESTWTVYRAPHPWGPWTRFYSEPTTQCYFACTAATENPLGLYDPVPVSKFVNFGGLSDVVFGSGDYTGSGRANDNLYRLHAFPLTLTTTDQQLIDDKRMQCTYSGTWYFNFGQPGYYLNTYTGSPTAGNSASCTFNGTSITWIGAKNHDHGFATVSIDGGPATQVDGYAPQWTKQQVMFQKDGLSPGEHTITITVTSQHDPQAVGPGTWQDIDAFIVGQ